MRPEDQKLDLPDAAEVIRLALDGWDVYGPTFEALLHGYVTRVDESRQTEQALFIAIHVLGEKVHSASFRDICALMMDPERATLVLGEAALTATVPSILISTFDGDPTPLYALVESVEVDELLRGEVLLVLAYLARSGRIPESALYEALAALADRLRPRGIHYVWFGWVRAVAALGFAGLAGKAEAIMKEGLVDPDIMNLADFWQDMREAVAEPGGMAGPAWEGVGPMSSAMDAVNYLDGEEAFDAAQTPAAIDTVRNPLRHIGRNDPCPCGSGKKYKKCCLPA